MNEAIRIAIKKGGYRSYYYDHGKGFYQRDWVYVVNDELNTGVSQNPFFWKSLSKALGWDKLQNKRPLYLERDGEYGEIEYWEYYAHRWLDSHFQGETAEKEFWKELLKGHV